MTLFCGKQSNSHASPFDLTITDKRWFVSSNYSSLQFHAMTLSNGSPQSPMLAKNPQTMLCCLADAYISNKKEILARLDMTQKESSFLSDAELILASYQRWGINCVNFLCGDFVFVIWDPTIQQLFLVRDPMGYRTIFYHITNTGDLFFSNTVKLLIEQFDVNKEINPQKVASFLTLLIEDGEMTFYKNISKVPAGFYLQCSTRHPPELKRYWNAENFLNDPIVFNDCEDYYHHFRSLFEEVVESYLPYAGNVASHLSGGLDSSSVAAAAARNLQRDNRTLTTFGHVPFYQRSDSPLKKWSYCDRIYMEAFLEQYNNISHHYIDLQEPANFSSQFQSWLDQPAINPFNMSWWMNCVSKAQDLNIPIILTGQGGNVTISWSSGSNMKPARTIRSIFSTIKETCQSKLERYPWKSYSAVHPRLARKTNLNDHYAKNEECTNVPDPRAYYFNNNMMDYSATIYMPMRYLYHVNHFDPTLDRRIVEFCLRAPLNIFRDNHRSRLLVRQGLGELLPPLIRERILRGMQSADWYMQFERNKHIFRELLHQWQTTHVSEYIDINHLLALLKKWNYKKVQQSQARVYQNFVSDYQMKFLRAIETGLFLN